MMSAERQQQDDGERDADQPQQDGTHNFRLLIVRPGATMVWAARQFRRLQDRRGCGFCFMLPPPKQGRLEHDRGSVEHDHQNQPAQHLDVHFLDDLLGDE